MSALGYAHPDESPAQRPTAEAWIRGLDERAQHPFDPRDAQHEAMGTWT